MDLHRVTTYRSAQSRADLQLAPGEQVFGGGTWVFSDPDTPGVGLVDLTTIGWPALEETEAGLRIAATCTIAELIAMPSKPDWPAQQIFRPAAEALLASFKIWHVATVGGNICRSFAAGAMISLSVGLDGVAEIWTPDGGERYVPVAELITGNGTNSLAPGEVLRAVLLPTAALRSRAALRKIALAELGRSGAVVTGRVDDNGSSVFTITAATPRPTVLHYHALPTTGQLRADVLAVDGYYTDPLGTTDWRRAVSAVLAEQIREELEE